MVRISGSPRAVLGGIALLGISAAAVAARTGTQGGAAPPIDKYALREVAFDFPPGFQLFPEYRHSKEEGPLDFWRGMWMGATMRLGERPSPQNKIVEGANVRGLITGSPVNALEALRIATSPTRLQVNAISGSYSGRKIGDVCLRGGGNTDLTDRGGVLFFVRGPVFWEIGLHGRAGVVDWSAAVEDVAVALVDRVDAAMVLEASGTASVSAEGKQLAGRNPNGVAVVHVKEFADAVGAKADADFPGGTATITANGHTLLLHVGRKEAWLDGKPITLPFPALRHGPDQVWCPVQTLNSLGFGATALRAMPKR